MEISLFVCIMVFSKSFGYALRGILFVAMKQGESRKIQIEEMAAELGVPRHYLGKIMKLLVKEDILDSTKGPYGGFSLHARTLQTTLLQLLKATDGLQQFSTCALSLRKCNSRNPCPLHKDIEENRNHLLGVLSRTCIGDLLGRDKKNLIRSISV